jgi:transcriptional regulator with XRE-family HTH domain
MEQATPSSNPFGVKLAELRKWRGLSQQVVADRVGVSQQYISMVESGERQVDKRSTLEALAQALRVSPVELGGMPTAERLASANPGLSEALGGLDDIEAALTEIALGEAVGTGRPVPMLLGEVEHLNNVMRPNADDVGQVRVLPGLIRDLNGAIALDTGTETRERLLLALLDTYRAAAMVTKSLRVRGLPAIAAMHVRRVAEELDQPSSLGMADYMRVMTIGSSRTRKRELAVAAADRLSPSLGTDGALEVYGALHLTAALSAAATEDASGSLAHLAEADNVAAHLPDDGTTYSFANLNFSSTNVKFWRTAISVELGDHGRVAEIAADVTPERVPSRQRQSAYWGDVGRGLAHTKATRENAVEALLRAERLAPVQLASDVYVRSTVTDLLPRVRRDSTAGRELRALAYRMGIAAA